MRRIVGDPAFRYVARGYIDELPMVLHRSERVGVGALTSRMYRLVLDKFVLWQRAYDENGQPVTRTADDGEVRAVMVHRRPVSLEDPDEWLMPVHEAMKRIRGHDRPYSNGYRWLRHLLAWRGLPCLCACPDVVVHLALREHTTPDDIAGTVISAARECVRKIERAGAMLDTPDLTRRARRRRATHQRTFEPGENLRTTTGAA